MYPVTYCTNIHPGESWAETREALTRHTLAVKAALCPDAAFPVGLRVSGLASRQVDQAEARRFKGWLDGHGLTVSTLNGFPYGRFHGAAVKAAVYLPDWRDPERLAYTIRLADLLAEWLPHGQAGSISSVPLGFRRDFDPAQEGLATGRIVSALEHLDGLAQRTGKLIRLSLEPEPGCLLETTPQVVEYFARLNLPPGLVPYLAVCYDCCHQALQFEDPAESLALLTENAILIGHVQVSSALHLEGARLSGLARYDEPVYLHQAVGGKRTGLIRYDDLGPAMAAKDPDVECWRVHFHLPVFLERLPECRTTQEFLRRALPLLPPDIPMEVETYTWSVLPPDLQAPTMVESIVREIRWVEACRRRTRFPAPLPE